jgi:hypothetical protein
MTELSGPQNQSRVTRIVEVLDLIHKSARSQKAGPDEERELLQPVFDKLEKMGWHMKPAGPVTRPSHTIAPRWDTVRRMSQDATLSEMTIAMAIYLSRIDEALDLKCKEQRNGS